MAGFSMLAQNQGVLTLDLLLIQLRERGGHNIFFAVLTLQARDVSMDTCRTSGKCKLAMVRLWLDVFRLANTSNRANDGAH